jgi:hypothetical protein
MYTMLSVCVTLDEMFTSSTMAKPAAAKPVTGSRGSARLLLSDRIVPVILAYPTNSDIVKGPLPAG